MRCNVIVVGGGHNGLVASIVLARHGLKVCVFEKHYGLGGLAGSGVRYGVMFDRFAYVVGLFDPLVKEYTGIDLDSLLVYPEPNWVEVYDGKIYLEWWTSREKLFKALESLGADARGFYSDVDKAWSCLKKTGSYYTIDPPSLSDAAEMVDKCSMGLGWLVEKPVRSILRAYFPEELWPSIVYPIFFDEPGYILLYFHQHYNVWGQPVKSMASISLSLARKALLEGVEIYNGVSVRRLYIRKGVVRGVVLDSGKIVESNVVLYASSILSLPQVLGEDVDLLGEYKTSIERLALEKSMVTRIDIYISRKPSPPRGDGWRGTPLYSVWGRHGGGEVVYTTLNGRRNRGVHLVQFSGVYYSKPEDIVELIPGVRDEDVVDIDVRGWESQVAFGNPSGNPNHVPMTRNHLFDSRPLPGWAPYTTPIPCLYHGSASSHPGGQVTGVPGLNAALRIIHDMGLKPKLKVPGASFSKKTTKTSWDARRCRGEE